MAISVVIGAQYGSEGKGKVAHQIARDAAARAAVRVGGSNSGHTAFDRDGGRHVLRQLPTAALIPDVLCVIPPGAYVDAEVLVAEIRALGLAPDRVIVDPKATLITQF